VVKALEIEEGDELDFLPYTNRYFIIAKKSDITALIVKPQAQEAPEKQTEKKSEKGPEINGDELAVLKKLDMLRYSERTQEKITGILNGDEKQVLQRLIKRGFVLLYKKGSEPPKYSIQKKVYDAFMWRKKPQPDKRTEQLFKEVERTGTVVDLGKTDGWINELQSKGYLVLTNEAEASNLSAALEESIRNGLVVGTRAFNKKFYIMLKSFVNKNAPKIFEVLGKKTARVDEISRLSKLEENAVRAILYILAEGGEVSEVKKDLFKTV